MMPLTFRERLLDLPFEFIGPRLPLHAAPQSASRPFVPGASK
jgi:hypothetical protein